MRTIGIILFIVVVIPIGLYLKKKQMERTNKYGTTVHGTFGDFIKTTIWERYILNIIGLLNLLNLS
jgi:hypothetical protein